MPIILVRSPMDMYYTEILGDIHPSILEVLRLNEGWKEKDWDFVKKLKRRKKYLTTINLMVQDVLAIICSTFDFVVAQSTVYLSNPEGDHYMLYVLQKIIPPTPTVFYDYEKDLQKRHIGTDTLSRHKEIYKDKATETDYDERYEWLPVRKETEEEATKDSEQTPKEEIAESGQQEISVDKAPKKGKSGQGMLDDSKANTELAKVHDEGQILPSGSMVLIPTKRQGSSDQNEKSFHKLTDPSFDETEVSIKTLPDEQVTKQKELIEETKERTNTEESDKTRLIDEPPVDHVKTSDQTDGLTKIETKAVVEKQQEDVEPVKESVRAEESDKLTKISKQEKAIGSKEDDLFTAISDLDSEQEHNLLKKIKKKKAERDKLRKERMLLKSSSNSTTSLSTKSDLSKSSGSDATKSKEKIRKAKKRHAKHDTKKEHKSKDADKQQTVLYTELDESASKEEKDVLTSETTKEIVPSSTQVAAEVQTLEVTPFQKEKEVATSTEGYEIKIVQTSEPHVEQVDKSTSLNQLSVSLMHPSKLSSGRVEASTSISFHMADTKAVESIEYQTCDQTTDFKYGQDESIKTTEHIESMALIVEESKFTHETEELELQETKRSEVSEPISTSEEITAIPPQESSYVDKVNVIIKPMEESVTTRSIPLEQVISDSSPFEAVASTSRPVKSVSFQQVPDDAEKLSTTLVKSVEGDEAIDQKPRSKRRKRYVRRRKKYDLNEVIDRLSRAFTGNIMSKPKRSTSESSDDTKRRVLGTKEFQVGYVLCDPPTQNIFDYIINLPRTLSEKMSNFFRKSYQSLTSALVYPESSNPVASTSKAESDSECDEIRCEPSTSKSYPDVTFRQPLTGSLLKPTRGPLRKAASTPFFREKPKTRRTQEQPISLSSELFGGTLRLKMTDSSTESSHRYERETTASRESSTSTGSSRVQTDLPLFTLPGIPEYDRPSTSTSSNGS